MRALAILERKLGKPLAKIDFNNLMIDELITIVWAGLIHEDKEISVDGLFDIIDNNNITYEELIDMMTSGLSDSHDSNDEVKDENPNQAAAGN